MVCSPLCVTLLAYASGAWLASISWQFNRIHASLCVGRWGLVDLVCGAEHCATTHTNSSSARIGRSRAGWSILGADQAKRFVTDESVGAVGSLPGRHALPGHHPKQVESILHCELSAHLHSIPPHRPQLRKPCQPGGCRIVHAGQESLQSEGPTAHGGKPGRGIGTGVCSRMIVRSAALLLGWHHTFLVVESGLEVLCYLTCSKIQTCHRSCDMIGEKAQLSHPLMSRRQCVAAFTCRS